MDLLNPVLLAIDFAAGKFEDFDDLVGGYRDVVGYGIYGKFCGFRHWIGPKVWNLV